MRGRRSEMMSSARTSSGATMRPTTSASIPTRPRGPGCAGTSLSTASTPLGRCWLDPAGIVTHSSPRHHRDGVRADTPDADLAAMCSPDVLRLTFVGHTHMPLVRDVPWGSCGQRRVGRGGVRRPARRLRCGAKPRGADGDWAVNVARVPYDGGMGAVDLTFAKLLACHLHTGRPIFRDWACAGCARPRRPARGAGVHPGGCIVIAGPILGGAAWEMAMAGPTGDDTIAIRACKYGGAVPLHCPARLIAVQKNNTAIADNLRTLASVAPHSSSTVAILCGGMTLARLARQSEVVPSRWLFRSFRAAGFGIGLRGAKTSESRPRRVREARILVAAPHLLHRRSRLHGIGGRAVAVDSVTLVRRSSLAVQIRIGATGHNSGIVSGTYAPSCVDHTSGTAH